MMVKNIPTEVRISHGIIGKFAVYLYSARRAVVLAAQFFCQKTALTC